MKTTSFEPYSHRKEGTGHTFCNSPKVFPSLDNAAIRGGNIFGRSYDGERHGVEKYSSVFSSSLVIGINGRLVNADALSGDHLANLRRVSTRNQGHPEEEFLTRCLNA